MKLNKQKVYNILKTIPKGKVTTYASIARALKTTAYRAIGQILRQNPNAPLTPCHRVVRSNGLLGGYKGHYSPEYVAQKYNYLTQEGVIIKEGKIKDFGALFFEVS